MTVTLWILGSVLSFVFLGVGTMVLVLPRNTFMYKMGVRADWGDAVPSTMYKLSGIFEILGAFGVALPAVTKIAPNLTSLAALGLVALMAIAVGVHIGIKDKGNSVYKPIALIVLLCAFLVVAQYR